MKQLIFLLLIVTWMIMPQGQEADTEGQEPAIFEPIESWADEEVEEEAQQDQKQEQEEAGEEEKDDEDDDADGDDIVTPENRMTEVDRFYKDRGFSLFPKWIYVRNTVRVSLYHDTNSFLEHNYERSDTVWSTNYNSNLSYRRGRFGLDLSGGVTYVDYFSEDRLDEILFNVRAGLKYESDRIYVHLTNSITRNTIPSTLEFNDRSPWMRYSLNATVGTTYNRWFFEVRTNYNLVTFEKIRGDYQTYGQTYIAGYKTSRRVYVTINYNWDYIDYLEAYSEEPRPTDRDNVNDSMGHGGGVGVRIKMTNVLYGEANVGYQHRGGRNNVTGSTNLNWTINSRMQLSLNAFLSTLPSIFGEYRYSAGASLIYNYAITRQLGLTLGGGMTYSSAKRRTRFFLDTRLRRSRVSYGYFASAELQYKIYKGLSIHATYRGNFRRSNTQPAEDYDQHHFGGALSVTF